MKVKVQAFLHWRKYEWESEPTYVVESSDMSDTGTNYALISVTEIELEVPNDFDPAPAIIAALRSEKQKILANAHVKAENIEEQIQKLLCIEHKPDLEAKAPA